MKSRISIEIVDSILRSVRSGTTTTRIMYSTYLSYSQVKNYLSILLAKALIKYEPETGLYKITPNGIELVRSLEEIRVLVDEPKHSVLVYPMLR